MQPHFSFFIELGRGHLGGPRALILTITLILGANENRLFAADIQGRVEIHGGSPLRSFSPPVVFIDGLKGAFSPQKLVMNQRNKQMEPDVLPLVVGSSVQFPNQDFILHNIFSISKAKKFDLGLYKKGPGKTVTFEESGLVKVYCNIHEKMIGHILVLENPYYSLVDDKGDFKISNIPEGSFQISVWHRFSDRQSKDVIIKGSQVLIEGVDWSSSKKPLFDLSEIQGDSRHFNKFGEPYRDKY